MAITQRIKKATARATKPTKAPVDYGILGKPINQIRLRYMLTLCIALWLSAFSTSYLLIDTVRPILAGRWT